MRRGKLHGIGSAIESDPANGLAMATAEDNKLLAAKFFEDVVANGQVDLLDTLAAVDIVDHAAETAGWATGEGRDSSSTSSGYNAACESQSSASRT